METKKNNKADLEKRRSFFFRIGLVISLAVALMAFEWKSKVNSERWKWNHLPENETEILPPITRTPEPKIKKPPLVTRFKVVDDKTEIKTEITIETTEVNQNSIIEIKQRTEIDDGPEIIFHPWEAKPEFKGGDEALFAFIKKNVRYPDEARMNDISATVFVTFIVNKQGKVTNPDVERLVGFGLDEEALRVISLLPDWEPGKQNGKPVSVYLTIPIKFTLLH